VSRTRTFIAVELSPAVRGRAEKLINQLRVAGAKVSWVQPQHMHLTLKFLGDVPDSDLSNVCRAVAEGVKDYPAFELTFRGCGAFPNLDRPRTIWIGVDEGHDEIVALQAAVDAGLKKLGFPKEPRRFRPHLTLGRVRETGPAVAELARLIEQHADFDADIACVDEVTIFASYLEKAGPTHEPLGHAELAG
jgi:2'-5' RNA ligase